MDMPKRSKTHQVEDLSINALKLLLPREWVYREKDKDYGIDGEIEVFSKEGFATGIVFYVQLKATDLIDPKMHTRVQLANEAINYYKSLSLPTLLVRYAETTKNTYIQWAHTIDRYTQKEGAKSFTFYIDKDNLWDENTSDKIVTEMHKITAIKSINNLLPISTYLNFSFDNINKILPSRLKSSLRRYLSDKENIIQLETSEENSLLSINITDNTLFVDIAGISGCYFHHIDSYDYSINELIGDIFTSVTIALFHLGKKFNGITIFETLVNDGFMSRNPEVLLNIIFEYSVIGQSEKVMKLWKNISDEFKDEKLNMKYQMITLMASTQNNSTETYEQYLRETIEKFENIDEEISLGIAYYNYASFLRDKNNRKSFSYYVKALKNNPHYYSEHYIFKEIAGLLFDLKKYSASIRYYRIGIDLKEDMNSLVLYADALMHQGKYLDAKEKFVEYFDKKKTDIDPEWHLKESILGVIVNDIEIKEQKRSYYKAMNTDTLKNCTNKEIKREEYQYIIKNIDALNPLCHFNLGILSSKNEEFFDGTIHFLICALVNRTDVESWFNSFKSALNSNEYEIIPLIISCAYNICGEQFIELIYDVIENGSSPLTSESDRKFFDIIDNIVNKVNEKKLKNKRNIPTLRIFDGKEFKEINMRDQSTIKKDMNEK